MEASNASKEMKRGGGLFDNWTLFAAPIKIEGNKNKRVGAYIVGFQKVRVFDLPYLFIKFMKGLYEVDIQFSDNI
jgi:hypothetical protein